MYTPVIFKLACALNLVLLTGKKENPSQAVPTVPTENNENIFRNLLGSFIIETLWLHGGEGRSNERDGGEKRMEDAERMRHELF